MKLLSCFPGCGKTTLAAQHPEINDSDSSTFDKAEFPSNYLQHLQEKFAAGEPTLISTHLAVREGLRAAGIPFTLVYPEQDCKDEYRERYIGRLIADSGVDRAVAEKAAFVQLLDQNWDQWIEQCHRQLGCVHLRMYKGEYLSDVVRFENNQFVPVDPIRPIVL